MHEAGSDPAADPVGEPLLGADAREEASREAAAQHFVHHHHREVVGVVVGDAEMADADVGLGDVVLFDEVDARLVVLGDRNLTAVERRTGGPAAERRGQLFLHFGAVEVADDTDVDAVGVVVLRVPGHQIVAADGADRGVLLEPRHRRVFAVDQAIELAPGDRVDVVVASRDLRVGLHLGQLQLVLGELGKTQHLHEHRQDLFEIVLQAVHRGEPDGVADPGLDRGGSRLEEVVDFVAAHRFRAAGALHRADDRGETGLVLRLPRRSGAHARGDLHERQLVVLDQEDLHPVVQLVDLGGGNLEGGELGELDIAVVVDLGAAGQRDRRENQGDQNTRKAHPSPPCSATGSV